MDQHVYQNFNSNPNRIYDKIDKDIQKVYQCSKTNATKLCNHGYQFLTKL
jgi:hypothetical protein